MKHEVSISGGVPSFLAAMRVKERFGSDDVYNLFADTRWEDEDLYRFLADAERVLEMPIHRISDGRTPFQVFRDERFLGNSRLDPCSKILKRTLLDRDRRSRNPDMDFTLYLGLDWTEQHRLEKMQARMPYPVEAPMCWPPYLTKTQMFDECERLGVRIPRLYRLGFAHNNCGGRCVKAGQAQWALLLRELPERYLGAEEEEQGMIDLLGDVSILRDRRGGKSTTLSLRKFRQRLIDEGEYDRFDWGGCGCAVDDN